MASNVETAIRGAVTKGLMSVAGFNRGRMKPPADGNPFLQGLHTPMRGELTLTSSVWL